MIPENRLSTEVVLDKWLIGADDMEFSKTEGFTLGPTSIGNLNSELDEVIWKYSYRNEELFISRRNTTEEIPLDMEIPKTAELSLCFNQLSQPVVAFTYKGNCHLKWYDATLGSYVTENLGEGISTPKVILDITDKRSSLSDVIVFYMKDRTKLCCRYQRDRYTKEIVLQEVTPHAILRVGHNIQKRIQLILEEII